MNQPNGEETILVEALRLAPEQRGVYLDKVTAGNPALRQRVQSLLESYQAGDFLEQAPTTALGAELRRSMAAPEKPGDKIGRYKILQKIGEGGCGVVYLAEQEEPVRRRVALKIIKLGMDTKSVIARFEAERQALALMDHPNIAKVFNADETESGRPYFVMELVRGVKITDYCDQQKLSTRERLDLFTQVCHAIQHAHQKGVIHRDIKPSNILVTINDGVPVPKVIDFGIAKATGGQRLTDKTLVTAFEQFIGTPAYMSPEQALMTSVDVDTRSDVYALGVLLYELLTGKTPFDAKELLAAGLDEMRRTIREQEPERPSTRVSTLSAKELSTTAHRRGLDAPKLLSELRGDLDWIVMRCLEKDRARRYETANGLANEIQRYLNNEPVTARPPTAAYRVGKFVRRNRMTVISTGLVAGVLVLGICVSTQEALRATRSGHEQVRLRTVAQSAGRTANERLVRLNVANAVRLTDEGNPLGALAWIAESIRLSEGNLSSYDAGRYRFEAAWNYSPHLRVLVSHKSRIYAGSFSPDGRRFVTASADHTAIVWDAKSGQPVFPPLVHSDEVRQAVFSPNGQRIATIAHDATLWIWDAVTGQAVCPPVQHELDIKHLAFSPDGKRIVTASGVVSRENMVVSQRYSPMGAVIMIPVVATTLLGEAQVWDSSTGQALAGPFCHKDAVRYAAFSPDGEWIVTASDDESAMIWDVGTGKLVVPPLKHRGKVRCANFSPDGRYVITASEDHTAQLWDTRTGATMGTPFKHAKGLLYAAFSADGQRIVTTDRDQSACLWDGGNGHGLEQRLRHDNDVRYAEFSSDGRWLVTSGTDAVARVWDAKEGSLRAVLPHNSPGTFATFSPDSQRLLTVGHDHVARLWDLSPLSFASVRLSHPDEVLGAEFSSDGRLLLTSSASQTARLWDAQTGRWLGDFGASNSVALAFAAHFRPFDKHFVTTGSQGARIFDGGTNTPGCILLTRAAVSCAVFSPDGRLLAVGRKEDGATQVWDATNGQPLSPPLRHPRSVLVCTFSPDGSLLATGSAYSYDTDGSEVSVWDTHTRRLLSNPIPIRGGVCDLRFDPTGRYLLTAATQPDLGEREAQIWDWSTGRLAAPPLKHADGVPHAEFSPDGRRVVTASFDSTAQIWDTKTGQRLTPPLKHARQVEDACFSPDGFWVATASSDQTARVWEAATGEPLTPPLRHEARLRSVRFSPDGLRLVTASDDHTARIWQLARTEKPLSDLLLMAALLSGQRIDSSGRGVPVEPGELEAIWRTLSIKYPADFSRP